MSNASKLYRVHQVTSTTNTPGAGSGSIQEYQIPINGLIGGAGIVTDLSENIYISDFTQHVIYKYKKGATASMIIAGKYGVSGYSDGQGSVATFNAPTAMCIDKSGVIWIIDSGNKLIRKMTENGNVYTVASLTPTNVSGIAIDSSENIFILSVT